MKGGYRELSIRKATIPDGAGGEVEGLAIRLFMEDGQDPPDDVLGLTLLLPDAPPCGYAEARIFVDSVLAVFELEQ